MQKSIKAGFGKAAGWPKPPNYDGAFAPRFGPNASQKPTSAASHFATNEAAKPAGWPKPPNYDGAFAPRFGPLALKAAIKEAPKIVPK